MARRLLVAFLLIASLAVSIAAGIVAADWPAWQRLLQNIQQYSH